MSRSDCKITVGGVFCAVKSELVVVIVIRLGSGGCGATRRGVEAAKVSLSLERGDSVVSLVSSVLFCRSFFAFGGVAGMIVAVTAAILTAPL